MLAYWGGYSMTEIAERLDIPVGTVKTRCRAALASLKLLLLERGPDAGLDQALSLDQAGQASVSRDELGRQRDQLAGVRDDEAGDRNMQADLRDVAASRLEELADERLATATTSEQLLDLYLASRRSALAERSRAAADRHAEAEDRYAAERDRHDAAADRQVSAADRREASLDALTGAYTRAEGFRNLHFEVASARRTGQDFILAFLDVDGLKAINDERGHEAGDRALVRVVTALRTHLRPRDLVIRFGGDEFLCALSAIDEAEVTERLAQVSGTLAQTPDKVRITVGLARLGPEESIDDLFRRADAAFYDTRKRR